MEQLIPPIPPDARVECICAARGEIEITHQLKERGGLWFAIYCALLLASLAGGFYLLANSQTEPFFLGVFLLVGALIAFLVLLSIVLHRRSSCGVRQGRELWIKAVHRLRQRHKRFTAADIVAIEATALNIRIVHRTANGWRSHRFHFVDGHESNHWLAGLLRFHLSLDPLPARFAVGEPEFESGETIRYSFSATRNIEQRPVDLEVAAARRQSQLLRQTLDDGTVILTIPRRPFFRLVPFLVTTTVLSLLAAVIIWSNPVARVLAGIFEFLILLSVLASAWRRWTRVTLQTRPGKATLTIRTPLRRHRFELTPDQYVGVWRQAGELRALRPDQRVVRLLIREPGVEEMAEQINEALQFTPLAKPVLEPTSTAEDSNNHPVEAPQTAPPNGSITFSRSSADSWRICRPARRASLIFPAVALTAAAIITWLFLTFGQSSASPQSWGMGTFIWVILLLVLQERIVTGLFPTTLNLDNETLRYHHPTLLGHQDRSCNRWAISGLHLSRQLQAKRPAATLTLELSNHTTIRLFPDLAEEDARWLAALLACDLGMTAAE